MHMHKHEDILREEIIDESKLPKGVRLKRTAVNHARVFLAAFSQKFFFRHRSLLTTIVEVFFSPLMVLLILSAFTHGISWDKAMNDRKIACTKILSCLSTASLQILCKFIRDFVLFQPRLQ